MASKTIIETTMKVGSTNVSKAYVGSSEVKAIYKGSTRIYDKAQYNLSCSNLYTNANGGNFTPSAVSSKKHGDNSGTESVGWSLYSVSGTGASKSGNVIIISSNTSSQSRSGSFTIKQTTSNQTVTGTWYQSGATASYGTLILSAQTQMSGSTIYIWSGTSRTSTSQYTMKTTDITTSGRMGMVLRFSPDVIQSGFNAGLSSGTWYYFGTYDTYSDRLFDLTDSHISTLRSGGTVAIQSST